MIDVIKLATEAGASTQTRTVWPPTFKHSIDFTPEQINRFAALLLEEAAKICDRESRALDCAKAIRAAMPQESQNLTKSRE